MTPKAAGARPHGAALFRLVDSVLGPVETGAAIVGGVAMVAAMALMAADAILRYLFSAPIGFAPRLIESYLMVMMFAMPLAWGFRTGGYIRIVGAVLMLPVRVRNLLLRVGLAASGAYVAVLAWTGARRFVETWHTGEVYVSTIDWPVRWSWIWVPIGLGLLAVRLLLMVFGPTEDLLITNAEGTDDL